MQKGMIVSLAIGLASGLLVGSIGTSCAGPKTNMVNTGGTAIMTPSGTLSNGVRVIQVRAKKYEFIPGEIVVRQGEKVRLDLSSEDVTHGIELSEFKVDQRIEPGKPVSVEFIAAKAGTYAFHCSVFCGMGHMSMRGKLEVLPSTTP